MNSSSLPRDLLSPPREFTVVPFWFWNDELTEAEILRQIADFEDHGVHGFVIHPRVGLPRHLGWNSPALFRFMRLAVEEAARRNMTVVLYDEGMYPSGSSSGQVVAENPEFGVRGLSRHAEGEALPEGANLIATLVDATGQPWNVVDRPVHGRIRGLHYLGEGPDEEMPPAADLLNPEAMACFVRLVYDRYAAELGDYFGKTIIGIFTDEPSLLGRGHDPGVVPGTPGILAEVNRLLGRDFTPHLLSLWDDRPATAAQREAYHSAVKARLEETYYQPLCAWCRAHGVALMGHPDDAMDIGMERYFDIPGQDVVWRWILPNDSALEGRESTQGKCTSSAALHQGRRRNSNECFGAYGHEFDYLEMRWVIDWLLVRGVNFLIPHAFYYSIRGPRRDERPPDVGPNSAWWDEYRPFADYCRRMSWLNTDGQHLCDIAILTDAAHLPWDSARVLFENARDFNYLEARDLVETAAVTAEGVAIAGMQYRAVVADGSIAIPDAAQPLLAQLADAGRLVWWSPGGSEVAPAGATVATSASALVEELDAMTPRTWWPEPVCPGLRVREVTKEGTHFVFLFNEGQQPIEFGFGGNAPAEGLRIDPATGESSPWNSGETLRLARFETALLAWP